MWLVTAGTDDDDASYWDKGWCQFEYALTSMIKVANTSAWAEWPQVVDLGQVGREAQINVARPPPAEPLAFYGGHEYGDKKYREANDRDDMVAPIFRDTVRETCPEHTHDCLPLLASCALWRHRPVCFPRATPLSRCASC